MKLIQTKQKTLMLPSVFYVPGTFLSAYHGVCEVDMIIIPILQEDLEPKRLSNLPKVMQLVTDEPASNPVHVTLAFMLSTTTPPWCVNIAECEGISEA